MTANIDYKPILEAFIASESGSKSQYGLKGGMLDVLRTYAGKIGTQGVSPDEYLHSLHKLGGELQHASLTAANQAIDHVNNSSIVDVLTRFDGGEATGSIRRTTGRAVSHAARATIRRGTGFDIELPKPASYLDQFRNLAADEAREGLATVLKGQESVAGYEAKLVENVLNPLEKRLGVMSAVAATDSEAFINNIKSQGVAKTCAAHGINPGKTPLFSSGKGIFNSVGVAWEKGGYLSQGGMIVGGLMVLDAGRRLAGIGTERDPKTGEKRPFAERALGGLAEAGLGAVLAAASVKFAGAAQGR